MQNQWQQHASLFVCVRLTYFLWLLHQLLLCVGRPAVSKVYRRSLCWGETSSFTVLSSRSSAFLLLNDPGGPQSQTSHPALTKSHKPRQMHSVTTNISVCLSHQKPSSLRASRFITFQGFEGCHQVWCRNSHVPHHLHVCITEPSDSSPAQPWWKGIT